jgi:tetratricopeptide (TPR) repeat protein
MLAQRTRLLCALGQARLAVDEVEEFLQRARDAHVPVADLQLEAALAYAELGDFDRALAWMDEGQRTAESQGRAGLALGMFYEARARIAIYMADGPELERWCERTRLEYEHAHNPDLSARLLALLQEARERGLSPSAAPLQALSLPPLITPDSDLETVHSRIAECMDRVDRARCALTLLLQGTYSSVGHLFAVHDGLQLELLSSLPDPVDDPGVLGWVQRFARSWASSPDEDTSTEQGDTSLDTRSDTADDEHRPDHRYRDRESRTLELALLVGGHAGERVLAGVLVVAVDSHSNALPSHQLCKAVAQALLDYGDCRGQRRPGS